MLVRRLICSHNGEPGMHDPGKDHCYTWLTSVLLAMQAMMPSTAVRRQMPARSARTTKKLVEIVSSSESDSSTTDDSSGEGEKVT